MPSQPRAFTKADCEARTVCTTPTAIYPGRTGDDCTSSNGKLTPVYRWTPGTSAPARHVATQWISGSGLHLNGLLPQFNPLSFRQFMDGVSRNIVAQAQRNALLCEAKADASLLAFACMCGNSEASCLQQLPSAALPVQLGSSACPAGLSCSITSGQTSATLVSPPGGVVLSAAEISSDAGLTATLTPSRRLGASLVVSTVRKLTQAGNAITLTLNAPLHTYNNASTVCIGLPVGAINVSEIVICAAFPTATAALTCQPSLQVQPLTVSSNQICISLVFAAVSAQLSAATPSLVNSTSLLLAPMLATEVNTTTVALPPVDCVLSNWTYVACDALCGGGVAVSYRTVLTLPLNDGAPCETLRTETACNTNACPAVPTGPAVSFDVSLTGAPATMTLAYKSSVRFALAAAAGYGTDPEDVYILSALIETSNNGRRLSGGSLVSTFSGYIVVANTAVVASVLTRLGSPAVLADALSSAGLAGATAALRVETYKAPVVASGSGLNLGLVVGVCVGGAVVIVAIIAIAVVVNSRNRNKVTRMPKSISSAQDGQTKHGEFVVSNPVRAFSPAVADGLGNIDGRRVFTPMKATSGSHQ
jgi:hypothetical protein